MPLILCLETSTKTCSVALGNGDKILGTKEITNAQFTHSENLVPYIKEVLDTSKIIFEKIEAVAISKGPGSYTGLRIGTSVAKGICYALDIPLIAVNSLEVLTRSFLEKFGHPVNSDDILCPMIDARRMEVYTSLFKKNLEVLQETHALIVESSSFKNLSGNIHFFGDGASKCKEVLIESNTCCFYDNVVPSAQVMIKQATGLFKRKAFEDTAYFEPYYLKDFIATTPKKLI